ncbi:MAG: heimdallarchaeosortase [Candidatus Hodarchaeales archaeon]|jgi:exosortase/archaeosortase family protein
MTEVYETKFLKQDSLNQSSSKSKEKKRFHDDKLMISTLLLASAITFLFYTVPDWVFIEIPTRNIIHILLNLLGIENSLIPTMDPNTVVPESLRGGSFPFLEATIHTPGIKIQYPNPIPDGDYWIVKACTGMQAGGLLIALIIVTEAPRIAKIRGGLAFLSALFIGNTLRITFHLWCVYILIMQFQMDPTEAFYWAHDVSTKVIGFFGTILFAFIIERIGGVPIIDQFADWLDWMWWRLIYIKSKLESFLGFG